jgi:heparanase
MLESGHARQLLLVCMISASPLASGHAEGPAITPVSMPRVGTIDQRFQSYNVEMVEVTGGNFWKPYGEKPSGPFEDKPTRTAPDLYAFRPPIDLTNARLRRLAAALAPAYLRVSGTWANATYFSDSDDAPLSPPAGFDGILTHRQ